MNASSPAPVVLLTGAAGGLATLIREPLRQACAELRLTDRRPFDAPGFAPEQVVVADLSELGAHPALLRGVDAIVHFAGMPHEADWDTILAANVVGVTQLWEAARAHGVKRIIHASSNHATGFYPRSQTLDHTTLPRPDSRYGVSKAFMEAVASLYADKHGIKAWGLRIGYCSVAPTENRMLSHWVHPEDLAQLVILGLTADYHCELVYGVSANSRSWWDNRRAEALGYRPRHSADPFIPQLSALRGDTVVGELYQGGSFAAEDYDGDPERPLQHP